MKASSPPSSFGSLTMVAISLESHPSIEASTLALFQRIRADQGAYALITLPGGGRVVNPPISVSQITPKPAIPVQSTGTRINRALRLLGKTQQRTVGAWPATVPFWTR